MGGVRTVVSATTSCWSGVCADWAAPACTTAVEPGERHYEKRGRKARAEEPPPHSSQFAGYNTTTAVSQASASLIAGRVSPSLDRRGCRALPRLNGCRTAEAAHAWGHIRHPGRVHVPRAGRAARLTMPRPGGLWALKPVLSNDAILGTEKVTAIEQRFSPTATVAGVNGDRFASNGRPSGILIRRRGTRSRAKRCAVEHRARRKRRAARGEGAPASHLAGKRAAPGLTAVNNSPSSSGTSLYTPAWGPTTPAAPARWRSCSSRSRPRRRTSR